jgi:predicted O-methyltransferase YrrM
LARTLASLRSRAYLWRRGLFRADRIPSHLTSPEKALLHRVASALAGGAVGVEIGSYLGASSCLLAAGLASRGGVLYCIDTWTNEAMSEGQRDTYGDFLRNTAPWRGTVRPRRGRSLDLAAAVAAEAPVLDLLFIDGDHSYEACRSDWDRYAPLLRPGGVAILHDTGWAEGVQRVVVEALADGAREVATLPNLRVLAAADGRRTGPRAGPSGPLDIAGPRT